MPRFGPQRRRLHQDGLFHGPQLGAGFDPQLLSQHPARRGVGAQRLGLASGPVQRQHLELPETLPQRVRRHQLLDLRHELRSAARLEIRRYAFLDRKKAQFLE